ncbi:hypothetical protein KCP73_17740 [Salmonella enterica subsp. enterica]|nr:hypothetical protein KCP73_17740 [Salmonella enterica subsp. enterica]
MRARWRARSERQIEYRAEYAMGASSRVPGQLNTSPAAARRYCVNLREAARVCDDITTADGVASERRRF